MTQRLTYRTRIYYRDEDGTVRERKADVRAHSFPQAVRMLEEQTWALEEMTGYSVLKAELVGLDPDASSPYA